MKVIENCRATGMKIVFVPTIVKVLNDHQIGDIVRVATENIDTVSGISFPPVAFTGRIAKHELLAKRFTLADLPAASANRPASPSCTKTGSRWRALRRSRS